MEVRINRFFLSVLVSLVALVSCVQEANDGSQRLDGTVADLSGQVASLNSSLEQLNALQNVVEQDLSELSAEIEAHIGYLKSGVSRLDGTMATLQLQKNVAMVIAQLQAAGYESSMTQFVKSVKSWLGKSFETYFDVLVYACASQTIVEGAAFQLGEHHSYVGAVLSDVEAGLRDGVPAEELATVLETLAADLTSATELNSKVEEIVLDLETECVMAIEALFGESSSYDASALKKASTQARIQLKSAEPTISDLVSRIQTIESAIETIQTKLSELRANVDELLGMIQSLTFMSDYSEEYAIAYYEMDDNKVSAPGKAYDGKNKRTPTRTIELNYMVRPASAAVAVTSDVVSVVGYYADQIQTKAIDPTKFVNFTVNSVSCTNSERGIVTITVNHDLKDDFYYRQTGAKCALFIATGQTDVSSKFVELYPKDNSATVYVEDIKINQDAFEIDEGQTKNLTVTVNPASATDKTVTWTSSNTEIATIDQYSGVLTAVKQGNVTITATTNSIDEWGDKLTASVNVKVNPSIRLGGPLYVEEGKTAELSLDFPPAMNVESKVWMSSDEKAATVENGIVTGVAHTYNEYTYQYRPVTITCIVNGNITLTHEISVVVPQPRQIKLNNYGDDVKSVTMKRDQTISLAGSILPDNVNASLFRITYESDGGVGWIDFSSGEIKAPGSEGGKYVYIKVRDKDKHTYMKTFVERTVIVNVEPYYVETMKFAQENVSLQPGQTSQISPILTSDVDGKQPTYREMTWTSSNPQVASVDAETGLITTHTEGNTVITATITPEAVPSGAEPLSASFTLIVETPVAPINVGDFFYSDGTWSTERDKTKTVIGIIFSNTPATADSKLMTDYKEATHGLVVGVDEYYHIIGYLSNIGYGSDSGLAMKDRCDIFNERVSNGYTNTFHLSNYSSEKGDSNNKLDDNITPVYWAELYHPTRGVLADVTTARPQGVSTWYIPSYNEMSLMRASLDKINASLNAAGGDTLSGVYWTSTFKQYSNTGTLDKTAGYNMANGSWQTYVTSAYKQTNPVRIVFAF